MKQKTITIMKKAGIIMIATAFIFSSFTIAAETNPSSNKIFNSLTLDNRNEVKVKQITHPSLEIGDVLFSQRPYYPDESWSFLISDSGSGYICQDDFWELTEPIGDIHWWGLILFDDNGYIQGNPNEVIFEIVFYKDNAGAPGDVAATYSNIKPTCTDTGFTYWEFMMFYFETTISPISLANGWISIHSIYAPDNSWLLWANSPEGNHNMWQQGAIPPQVENDCAFNLTAGTSPCCFNVSIEYILNTVQQGVQINVKNICDEIQYEVPWNITITGGLVLNVNGRYKDGLIQNFESGSEVKLKHKVIGLGNIHIIVNVDDCQPFEFDAFLIGPFTLRKETENYYYGCGC